MKEEEPIKNKDDSQQDIGDATDNSEIILDEPGDIMKPGPRGMTKNKKTANTDKELDEKENLESNDT